MRYYVFTFLFFALCLSQVYGQYSRSFTRDPSLFMEELEVYMESSPREEPTKMFKRLEQALKHKPLDSSQILTILDLSNKMRTKRMVQYPHFTDFLEFIVNMQDDSTAAKIPIKFDEWLNILNTIINNTRSGQNKSFDKILLFINGLILDHYLYKTRVSSWKSTSDDYQLKFEKGIPKLIINKLDLVGYTTGDTIKIYNTSGVYYPLEHIWKGKNGRIDWSRAGFDANDVYCELSDYEMNLTKSEYEFKNITFYFKTFLNSALEGTVIDKLTPNYRQGITSYPRFSSSKANVSIKNIVENVDYEGGFSLHGSKTIGSGLKAKDATLHFYKQDGSLAVIAVAKEFQINTTKQISSRSAATKIILGDDSITHPGVSLRFRIDNRKLDLRRENTTVGKRAFHNTRQDMDMYVESIEWEIDSDEMLFRMIAGGGQGTAVFESDDYFDQIKFDKYGNIMDYNPISVIKKYSDDHGGVTTIFAEEFAKSFNPSRPYEVSQIRGLLYELMKDGFIDYDQKRELISVKQKLFNYVLANVGKLDYDDLRIQSVNPEGNGVLDLKTGDLKLKGVNAINLSETKDLVVSPDSGEITIGANRDMQFSGSLGQTDLGRLEINGESFNFNYDSFKIDLKQVDSMQFKLPHPTEVDIKGNPILIPSTSQLENLSGVLYIDDPDNKSSTKENPEYPIFDCYTNAYIFYDKKYIQGGVYDRENFYFKLDPFRFDSLDNFDPEKIKFQGDFTSADIFPLIRADMIFMPDQSMGFEKELDNIGLPVYDGRGRFNGNINLSNQGLLGEGKLTYLSSTSTSDNVIFHPDSVIATVGKFDLKQAKYKGVTVPAVKTENIRYVWEPYNDQLTITKNDGFFDFYRNKKKFYGSVSLSPNGLSGSGRMEWSEAIIESNAYTFADLYYDVDSANIKVKSTDDYFMILEKENAKVHINVLKQTGAINSYNDSDVTKLPFLAYENNIGAVFWDIHKHQMSFDDKGKGSWWRSIKPEHHGLYFEGGHAEFNLSGEELTIEKVKNIHVVDVTIYPDSERVVIKGGGYMNTLENAEVIIDTVNNAYKFYNAEVKINGKHDFEASGYYDRKDAKGNIQKLFFQDIGVVVTESDTLWDKKEDTIVEVIDVRKAYAICQIDSGTGIEIDPYVKYKGRLELRPSAEEFIYSGYFKVDTPHPKIQSEWTAFSNELSTDSFYTIIPDPKNENREQLFTGIHLSVDTSLMYTTFLSKKRFGDDIDVITAKDLMVYDAPKREFLFGQEAWEKFNSTEKVMQGNFINFKCNDAKAYAEGAINLGMDLAPIQLFTAGSVNDHLNDSIYQFNIIMVLDFMLDGNLLELMAQDFSDLTFDLAEIDYESNLFQNAIIEYVYDAKKKELEAEADTAGGFNLPKSKKDIKLLLTDVKLTWDQNKRAYWSTDPIGVSYVGERKINKYVEAYLEIGRDTGMAALSGLGGGDFITLYFKLTNQDWYYFDFRGGVMEIGTSNAIFKQTLNDIKLKKRTLKKKKLAPYQYISAEALSKDIFIEKIRTYQNK